MRFVPGILSRNWQLKLPALAMAILLWTVLRFEAQNRQVVDNVPVRVQLNDPEWATLGEPLPGSVRAILSGPARELVALAVDPPSIVVPVNEVVSSDTAVLLLHTWVRLPNREGVSVESLEPSFVRLSFQPMEMAAIPVVPRLSGSLPEGLSLTGPPSTEPPLVRVNGPARQLEALDTLYLEPLDLTRIGESRTVRQAVDTTGLSGIALSPQRVAVSVEVEETGERVFADVPLTLPTLEDDPQVQARPGTVEVTVLGAGSRVEALNPDDVRVTVPPGSATSLAPGEETRVPVEVEGLPDLLRARVDPEWVVLRRPTGR